MPVTTKFRLDAIKIIRGAPALGWFIYITRIMVQLSRNLSLRKLWHHCIEISFSRVQLQDSLNRYWASAMTSNGVSHSPPVATQRISFDGKLTDVLIHASLLLCCPCKRSIWFTRIEYLSLSEIAFEWGDSYDEKDWNRLRKILAPTMMVCEILKRLSIPGTLLILICTADWLYRGQRP